MEESEISQWKARLHQCHLDLKNQSDLYDHLRGSFISIHQCLGPEPLATAFGYNEGHMQAFSFGRGGHHDTCHDSVTHRLLSNHIISQDDISYVSGRVQILLREVQSACLASEKITAIAKV